MKSFTFRPYRKKDLISCVNLMQGTWKDHLNFKGMKAASFYSRFLKLEVLSAAYREVVVDENDDVFGFFLATLPESKGKALWRAFCCKAFTFKQFIAILFGAYGHPKRALERFSVCFSGKNEIFKNYEADSELLLFILSPETRGHGIGKQIISRFFDYCRKNEIKKLILLTDSSCDVSYYDHNGWNCHCAISNDFFPEPEKGNNLFSYTLELE